MKNILLLLAFITLATVGMAQKNQDAESRAEVTIQTTQGKIVVALSNETRHRSSPTHVVTTLTGYLPRYVSRSCSIVAVLWQQPVRATISTPNARVRPTSSTSSGANTSDLVRCRPNRKRCWNAKIRHAISPIRRR